MEKTHDVVAIVRPRYKQYAVSDRYTVSQKTFLTRVIFRHDFIKTALISTTLV